MAKHPPFKQVEASRPPFNTDYKLKYQQTVDPNFVPGSGSNKTVDLPGVKEGLWSGKSDVKFKTINPSDENLNKAHLYKMLISGVTPRPIGFVSSVSSEGKKNLAPFSYFNAMCHDPPIICLGFTHPGPDTLKDSCDFILQTKNFTVNIISEPFLDAANYTSIDAPKGTSEWGLSGLTERKSDSIDAPRVGESGFSMECVLEHHYHLYNDDKKRTGTVVLGKVKLFHVREDLIDDELLVDTEKLMPVGRLGGITYGRTKEVFETPRPKWDEEIEKEDVKKALAKDGQEAKAKA